MTHRNRAPSSSKRSQRLRHIAVQIVLCLVAIASFLAIAAPATAQSLNDSARIAGWRSDIQYYLAQMQRQHYVYRSKPLPPGLISSARQLSQNVPRFSDERMLAEFEELASFAGDGHTYMLPFGSEKIPSHLLPIRFYLFPDGLYVVDAYQGNERWIGSKVLKIGATPSEQVVERLRPTVSVDNPVGYKWVGPVLLGFQGYLEKFAGVNRTDSVPITLRTFQGSVVNVRIAPVPTPRLRGIPKLLPSRAPGAGAVPLYLRDVGRNFWFESLAGDSATYVQFNQVDNAAGETLEAFARRLGASLETKTPRSLIIDVRHNNGGNLDLLPPLLEVLRKYESRSSKNRIYVLMGRNTFSAAQVFLGQVDRYTNAVFAGEPSSSRPNFVGEEVPVMLPWSKAIGSMSDRYHETIPGDTRQWIAPAIRYDLTAKDYFANRDPLLEMVIAASHGNRQKP